MLYGIKENGKPRQTWTQTEIDTWNRVRIEVLEQIHKRGRDYLISCIDGRPGELVRVEFEKQQKRRKRK